MYNKNENNKGGYMKKLFIFIAMLLVIPINCYALNIDDYFIAEEDSTIKEDTDHSVFIFGNDVSTEKNVNGLLFAFGQTVDVSGNNDYGFVFGNIINVNGNTDNDLYVFGQNVTIKGNVAKDLYVFGSNVKIDTEVSGNVFAYAQNLNIENAKVNGFILTAANTISISEDTVVGDVLKYNEDAIVKYKGIDEESSNIKVEMYKTANNGEVKKESTIATTIFSFFSDYLSRILVSFIIVGTLSKVYKFIVRRSRNLKNAFINSLWGFVVLVMTPLAFIIVLLTMIGVKLSFILLLAYILMLILANETSMIFIGNRIYTKLFKQKDNKFLSTFIGVTLISLLMLIPFIGGLVTFVSIVLGLGILIDMGIAEFKYCQK